MASKMLAQRTSSTQTAIRAARPARLNKLVCRAEDKSVVVKADRVGPNSGLDLFFASSSSLKYLDGTRAGDFGFDPLGLLDPVNAGGLITPEWLVYGEIINARWAMLGAAGCIAPEILGKAGLIPESTALPWYASGVIPIAGNSYTYWTDSFSLFFIEVILIQFAELKRLQDYRNPGSQAKQYFLGLEKFFAGSGEPAYPGGPFFNFANFGSKPEEMKKLKLNEIQNGRLAMLAMFGYGAQAVLTRQGPFQNLLDHLADPVNNNILTNFAKVYGQ